ncbi:MAG: hypothetical protein NVSMB57_08810 [Actinomycetota bacterium]
MHSFDEHVGRDKRFRGGGDERGIVPRADQHPFRGRDGPKTSLKPGKENKLPDIGERWVVRLFPPDVPES